MDFGDILKQWDEVRARSLRSGPKPHAVPEPPERAGQAKPKSAGGSPATGQPTATRTGSKSAATPSEPDRPSLARQAQLRWLEEHGVADKDSQLAEFRQHHIQRHLSRKEIDDMPYDATLDLHGLTALAAEEALEAFFLQAEMRQSAKVLIIHGKGIHSRSGPVLAELVRRWLERHPFAGRSGPADGQAGGSGATWVLVRRR
ncbi:MAG TPA: hypothetical protein DD477_02480 [Spirochaetaceae bacterium]|nr:hypothetical protein [Spirochaetaceae bacterium]